MSVETEIKIRIDRIEDFLAGLKALGPSAISERHFEDNFVLDFADARMRSQHSLIRVRLTDQKSSLTYKGPPAPEGPFKSRQELETRVEDGAVTLEILQMLGLGVWFRYQKYRREFSVEIGGGQLHVAVDETPVGNYAELEGDEKDIRAVASALGFTESQFIRASYYVLYLEFCRNANRPAENMLFG